MFKMPFATDAEQDEFFEDELEMNLSEDQRQALVDEGLETVNDFEDFKESQLKVAFKNARAAGEQIPAQSSHRLLTASKAWHHCNDTGRDINPDNVNFTNALRKFSAQFNAITDVSDRVNDLKSPMLSENNPPIKWCESFKHCLRNTFGVLKIPLICVIRESVAVPSEADDPLLPDSCHGASGSVLQDPIARISHEHTLFSTDNATVHCLIEQAARASNCLTTVKPFDRRKNGRGAFHAIVGSDVGDDKWERIQNENSKWLMSAKWNGKKCTLETFISQHRSKCLQLVESAEHLPCQTPDDRTRV